MIYLDNASTTKIDDRVLEAMMPYLTDNYGNAGTLYSLGRKSAEAVEDARKKVADLIHAKPENIVFTSGGSESNNMVFRGIVDTLKKAGKTHIVVSSIEHDSVLKAAQAVAEENIKDDFYLYHLPIDERSGAISVAELQDILERDNKVGLVSVMYVNNETGTVNPIYDIGCLCNIYGTFFHTDCVQAAGIKEIDVDAVGCDFASFSSHKIHGAKGCGALYCRNRGVLQPLISGGATQEYGIRGGTENVAGIVGFGEACRILKSSEPQLYESINSKREFFVETLTEYLSENGLQHIMHVNGGMYCNFSKIVNLRFDGVDGETLLLMLDSQGVCASAGSACRSHEQEPSHVLLAMGLEPEDARNSIRFSFSDMNTKKELNEAAKIVAKSIVTLYKQT